MAKNILVDTGFWYALYDDSDAHYADAQLLAVSFDRHTVIIPWPCLYETLNTRFVKRRQWLDRFSAYLARNTTVLLPDEAYRRDALERVFINRPSRHPRSLVDEVIRLATQNRCDGHI